MASPRGGVGQDFCVRASGRGGTNGRSDAGERKGRGPQVFVANVRYPGCSCAVAGDPFGGTACGRS